MFEINLLQAKVSMSWEACFSVQNSIFHTYSPVKSMRYSLSVVAQDWNMLHTPNTDLEIGNSIGDIQFWKEVHKILNKIILSDFQISQPFHH